MDARKDRQRRMEMRGKRAGRKRGVPADGKSECR